MKAFLSADVLYVLSALGIIVFTALAIRNHFKKLSSSSFDVPGRETVEIVKAADCNKAHYNFKTVLTVDGIVCTACAQRIENSLNTLDGTLAQADVFTGRVIVFTKHRPDKNLLCSRINSITLYKAVDIKSTKQFSHLNNS